MDEICSVSDCSKPTKRGGFCYGHYMKNWRYGTPSPVHRRRWTDLTGQRFGSLVARVRVGMQWSCDCDCGAVTVVRVGDLNNGNVSSCGNFAIHRRRDDVEYSTAHARTRADRGPAELHSCVGCGATARHWSYDHDDPNELHTNALGKNPIAYSVDPNSYSPRCVPCHKRFDLDHIDAHSIA